MRDIETAFKNYYHPLGLLVLLNVQFLAVMLFVVGILPHAIERWLLWTGGCLLTLMAVVTFFWKTGDYATRTMRSLANRFVTTLLGMTMTGVIVWSFTQGR